LIQYAAEEAIAAGSDTPFFVIGHNKRQIGHNFDANNELESMLRANGMDAKANMVRNIIPEGVEVIFVRHAEYLDLKLEVLCSERMVVEEPFAVLLADDFLTDYKPKVTSDLADSCSISR
jgi:UTP--glucose-1-phosphate uridylyltransferase